jgi:two-component system osmolarity sensor histidine kinase EnvZ
MIYTLAGEISLISKLHDTDSKLEIDKLDKIDVYTFLQYKFHKGQKHTKSVQKLSKELNILKSNIQYNLPNSSIGIRYNKKLGEIEVDIETQEGLFSFEISKNRIFASSTHVFILWMIGSTMILLLLTVLFAKNQIKSITKLSIAADKFSKGGHIGRFTPQGAIEVKRAGEAIIKMKEKIEHQVQQKSKMLAGVSHDLRTPITRLKLELEIMKKDQHTQGIREDISQMENTINDYLEFAKGDDNSAKTLIDLNLLFKKFKTLYSKNLDIEFSSNNRLYVEVKQNQFKRAIANLLDNAQRFASKALIRSYKDGKKIIIEIHDNGPGIPKSETKKVLEPFYRIDSSRNQESGGIGLGMSISNEIIEQSHGTMEIHRSSTLGGLLILINIPAK